ncbi:MAG: HAD-IA family hydrolase [Deltaproteobacteria bacterium]|nr:HAD-IA family hydrolase [Deltaproteobacteria bacterium]
MQTNKQASTQNKQGSLQNVVDIIALDMGNVLVNVNKKAVSDFLNRSFVDVEKAFFANPEHSAMSRGASPEGFLEFAQDALGLSKVETRDAWCKVVSVKKGAVDLVSRLNKPAYAWSNTDVLHFAAFSCDLPATLFEPRKRALSFEVRADKPASAFFEAALERLGVPGHKVFFVDDKPENIAAAKAFGIHAFQADGLPEVERVLAEAGLLD